MVKTIPIKDDELHTAFKIECIRRSITITDATEEAIKLLLERWSHPATATAAEGSGGERSDG